MADVFMSYCRDDVSYLTRLLLTLKGYDLAVSNTCWSDLSIQPGRNWQRELQDALASARLGILLVTPGFLASDFIRQHELPVLLARAEAGTLTLVPIPVRAVDWQAQKFSRYQPLLDPKEPLASLASHDQDKAYVVIGQFIIAQLRQLRVNAASAADPFADQLTRLQRQRSRRQAEGHAVDELTEQIKEIRRRWREGRLPQPGDVLCDRYELEQQLGSGGFATVWRAMDRQLNRLVALKLLHGQYSDDTSRRERFYRGARKMAGLKHEGIVTVFEQAGQDGQMYFCVMEYLPGGDLEAAVLRGDIPREHWLPVLLQAGAALQYAHDQGLIHRDIKPSNILLDHQRRPRLCDFDLVRDAHSTAGTRDGLGTFVYAAPECLENAAKGDARADVFGLGMTFVFALAGQKLPLDALVNAPDFIGTLGLSNSLAQALIRAVALEHEQRTPTVAALCQEVQAALRQPTYSPGHLKQEKRIAPESVAWAMRSGQDCYGTWAEINVKGVRAVLRWIPPGSFMMGSPADEADRFDDEVQHRVTLTKGFWLGDTAVTQALWQAVMASSPSYFKGANLPMETVSWDDAVAFLDKLNQCAPNLALRLPTEAEWEYACRASTETPFLFGRQINSAQVNFIDNTPYHGDSGHAYRKRTVAVKSFPANAWGLYQMHGNVWEWCADYYADFSDQAVIDPRGPETGDLRVLRGGGWGSDSRSVRAACRCRDEPSTRYLNCGFRLARSQ